MAKPTIRSKPKQAAAAALPGKPSSSSKKRKEIEEDEEIESSSDNDSGSGDGSDDEDNVAMQHLASELYPDDEDAGKHKPRKQISSVKPGKESEFTSSRHAFSSSKLSVEDLLDGEQVNNALLKKQLSTKRDEQLLLQPLVKPVEQQRAERKLGYAQASDMLTEHWQDAVVANKKQKLIFPLKQSGENPSIRNVTRSTVASELEDQVAAVLKQSGLATVKEIIENEGLARNENAGELDEAAKAKMRALLFYAEQKAKRVAKIKSKTFRKLRKKKLHREEEEALERLRETDPELAREEDERQAMLRAKERASLRQKNTSKRMRELGKRNKGADAAATGRELQSKMKSIHERGGGSDEESEDGDSDGSEDVEEMALRHLASFEKEIVKETKGLAGMKFMQRAVEQEQLQAKQDAINLLKRLRNEGDEETAVELEGKRQFGTGRVEKRARGQEPQKEAKPSLLFEEVALEDKEEEETKSDLRLPPPQKQQQASVPVPPPAPAPAPAVAVEESASDNPWLSTAAPTLRNAKKAVVTASFAKALENLPEKPEQDRSQQEIVKRAFANVAELDFEEEKRELEEKEEEAAAAAAKTGAGAGWGSWTGLGVREKKPAPLPERLQGKKPKGLRPNVIVSSRTNKLHRKYQVEAVPYPFTSREQYEKSLQSTVGREWNTVKQHEKKILPDVQVKSGTIIQPIQLPTGKSANGGAKSSSRVAALVAAPKKKFASRKAMS